MMDIQKIAKTEKENVWVWGEDYHTGAAITIDSATFQVFDEDDSSVQASDDATIVDNSTVTPDVYGLVDCTAAGFTAEEYYEVRFTITIDSEVLTPAVPIKCIEKRMT
jgi:hypothetical protein